MSKASFVEAEIWKMARTVDSTIVFIRPVGSESVVPIFIGPLEAHSIFAGIEKIDLPRPLTHDLFMEIFHEAGMDISRIEINELRGSTFYARVVVQMEGKELSFDSRPSDAIAIATRQEAPIFIAENIVGAASIPTSVISVMKNKDSDLKNQSKLEELQETLDIAVEEENYEEAAVLRDQIRSIEESKSQIDEQIVLPEGVVKIFENFSFEDDPKANDIKDDDDS